MGNGASTEIEIFAEGELEAEFKRRGGAGDISIKKLIKKGYNDVIQTVIRPTRKRYDVERDLGEDVFDLPSPVPQAHHGRDEAKEVADGQPIVRRRDFELENDRGLKLQCSQWHIYADEQSKHPRTTPCLVYLHSNMGSRCDALRIRDHALQRGLSVFAFDFSGSGLSDGIYVTMGWNESKDLHFVLQYLEEDDSVESISFYAHSMGTFPAIVNVACRSIVKSKSLKAKLDSLPSYFRSANANVMGKPIRGMVLDGAYANMSLLTEELLVAVQEEGFKVPLSLLKLACAVVRQSVKKRADVDLELLRPIDFVKACRIPALFLTGEDDRYVGPHHSDLLMEKYGGPGVIMRVPGDHYTPRKDTIYADAFDFLLGAIRSVGMH
ncbi:hypothetical protein Poli38472_010563 [Pythium oligandrum]|uniref:Serine aminopeptidase S33 domain-containing protein n=1 Tax=Pythium oligandrum TaxID=41045 RepID=A0A8K1FB26_PYTOL|nr:hypothetical protein Poli38472_010563 [Pythium oligandrum]|eukprot:TMW55681.1 hypothetical protein Poli38472_010563 [Pythium oligandrum]